MSVNWTKNTIGTIKGKNLQGNEWKILIKEGANCICVFLELGEGDNAYFAGYFDDEQHCKNILKNNGGRLLSWFEDTNEVISVSLNTAYKASHTLLKYLLKQADGYKYDLRLYHSKDE